MSLNKIYRKDLYLETKNLILRPFKDSDAKYFVENYNDTKEYSINIPNFPYPYTLKEAKKFIKKAKFAYKKKTPKIEFAVFLKKENRVIGGVGIRDISFKHKRAESMSCISKKYWGTGYIYEAKLEIYRFAFNKLGFEKLFSCIFPYNPRSKNHVLKLGFKEQGYLRKEYMHKGKLQDLFYLELLKEDFKYKELKKKLLN